jgi:hypothetical protein
VARAAPDSASASAWSPSVHDRDPSASRQELVAELANLLRRDASPRLHLSVIVVLAGGAAFLASAAFLWTDYSIFRSMTIRYPASALCGYAAFLGLIRLWIALHRGAGELEIGPGIDIVEGVGHPLAFPGNAQQEHSGFDERLERASSREGSGPLRSAVKNQFRESGDGAGWFDFDGDVAWVLIAALCAVGGLFAIAYVIAMAPVLLAEVALDAAIVSALYRRLRSDDAGYWLTTVVTRTWVAALVVVAFAGATGFALHQVVPEARSIGGVMRAFLD